MDVEKRLARDAESFAKETKSLDEAGFLARTLAVLGLPSPGSDVISDDAPVAGRASRPASGREA